MTIALGIDTGGTYTDAVLVDQDSGMVLAAAKALTTYHDLSVGIGQAMAEALEQQDRSAGEVGLVALSTTLATNAIVAGAGSPICLLLIGYDPQIIQQYGFARELVTEDVVYLRGGHDVAGNEVEPLDEAGARKAIMARRDKVEAFAVSGYFSVRNPTHELRVRAMVEELTGRRPSGDNALRRNSSLPVTCGHELTTRLNAVRRATTTALNARLIPLLRELIDTLHQTLEEHGIRAPLMIVKGDGSLVRAEWAMRRPIETILSGPAASVVGAWHLAGRRDVWVVDVGGTTTDIASLRDSRPRLNPAGAQVGSWKTMVEALDVHTVGLGGDSEVCLSDLPSMVPLNSAMSPSGHSGPGVGWLSIGPRRVVPLCLLASEHQEIVDELRRQVQVERRDGLEGQFVLAQRQPTHRMQGGEEAVWRLLSKGPCSLLWLVSQLGYGSLVLRDIDRLEAQRLVLRASFTPTDALHVLGRFHPWDQEASRLGAELLAAQTELSPQALCERTVEGMSDLVAQALVGKILSDEVALPDWGREPSARAMLSRALYQVPGSDLECQLTLRRPVVAIGAPVQAYLPRLARQLRTELIVPPYAEVANAVGAVSGSVIQQLCAVVRPLKADRVFRLHLPDGVRDFPTVEAATAYAQAIMPAKVSDLAREAGASHIEVRMSRVDHEAPTAMAADDQVYLGTELTFTAVGRPIRADTSS